MARLPTVKLYKGKSKFDPRETLIVNTFDYQRNMNRYIQAGWKLMAVRDVTGTDKAIIEEAARESKVNQFRKEDPTESAKRGDKQRAFEARAMKGNVTTPSSQQSSKGALSSTTPTMDQKSVDQNDTDSVTSPVIDPDWQKLPWFSRRAYVEKITGRKPVSADHAVELMADYEKRNG